MGAKRGSPRELKHKWNLKVAIHLPSESEVIKVGQRRADSGGSGPGAIPSRHPTTDLGAPHRPSTKPHRAHLCPSNPAPLMASSHLSSNPYLPRVPSQSRPVALMPPSSGHFLIVLWFPELAPGKLTYVTATLLCILTSDRCASPQPLVRALSPYGSPSLWLLWPLLRAPLPLPGNVALGASGPVPVTSSSCLPETPSYCSETQKTLEPRPRE